MNELLRRISTDVEEQKVTLPESVICEFKMEAMVMEDSELIGKLIMTAGHYLCEIEKRENEVKELRSKLFSLNKFVDNLRKAYSIPYKQVLSEKNEKGLCPAKKFVSKDTVKQLEAMGKSDTEICNILEISRSTLWRRRKQWEHAADSKESKIAEIVKSESGSSGYRFNL